MKECLHVRDIERRVDLILRLQVAGGETRAGRALWEFERTRNLAYGVCVWTIHQEKSLSNPNARQESLK